MAVAHHQDFFLFGLSHGLVEGVINPLLATLYSTEKTKKIVACHAWWPAGLIIGGLLAVALVTNTAGQLLFKAASMRADHAGIWGMPSGRMLRARYVACDEMPNVV